MLWKRLNKSLDWNVVSSGFRGNKKDASIPNPAIGSKLDSQKIQSSQDKQKKNARPYPNCLGYQTANAEILPSSQSREISKVVSTAQAYVSALQCPMRRHDGGSEQIRFRVVRWLEGPSNRDLRKPKECVRYHQMLCLHSDNYVGEECV
ncbi:hypothetical protein CEXT_277171 [Caerostris extrusa]|uniref:Uncharacterized protein n=1 Tax=Caerostris extrusa TaxID=172846 RepID=A0AAV4RLW2_CAEEX|nr:hypothetical protein CEXT_277171 [Caerostris extrusa]